MLIKSARRACIRRPIPAPTKRIKNPKADRAARVVDNALSLIIAAYLPGLAVGFVGFVGTVLVWIIALCILFRIFF
jgi:hypothetical protein